MQKDGEVFSDEPYKSEVISYAVKKQVTPDFSMIFLRGIGCNWLVSVACFMGLQGRDVASKLTGIWWPIFGFVSLGFDHVVANMIFIPMAIWLEAPGISIGLYIWKGVIPALIGNIVGGAVFCSIYYWYMYIFEGDEMAFWRKSRGDTPEQQNDNRPKDDVEARTGASSS